MTCGVRPRVLFVSKPVAPPYRDGTKCLVRDLATHLERSQPIVMSTKGAPRLQNTSTREAVQTEQVYADAGSFSPTMVANARAALWLLTRSRADLWHFVFAPNRASSHVGRALSRIRRVPVVQTIASPPRSFRGIETLLFGDVVVAQSLWTRQSVLAHAPDCTVEVVPPVVGEVRVRTAAEQDRVRGELEISGEQPIFVYPGDLETSRGAEVVAASVGAIVRELPDAVVVFAYRAKTEEAHRVRRELEARLDSTHTRFVAESSDFLSLLATSRAVLFPVDDLTGKVDLPIALLESMALGVPVVTWDWGPLRDLDGAVRVGADDREAFVASVIRVAQDSGYRREVVDRQRVAIAERFSAKVVARAYEAIYSRLLAF